MSTTITSNYVNNKILNNTNKKENNLKINDILSATIENRTNEYITLRGANNQSINIPSKDVVGEIGDNVSFEVTSLADNKIALKQLGINSTESEIAKSSMNQLDSDQILELFKKSNFIVEEDVLETDSKKINENQIKNIIRKIQNDILFASGNTSSSAVTELLANNINITDVTLSIISKVTNEIDKKPFDKVSDEEVMAITEKYLKENNISSEGFEEKAEIIKALKDAGLNVNNNVSQIENALKKFENALSKENFEGLVELNNFSIDDFLENTYSTNNQVTDEVSKNEDLYKQLANKLGLTYNQEVKDIFNTFLAEDIPITTENIEKLQTISEKLNSLTKEDLISKMVEQLSKGNKVLDATLLDDLAPTSTPDYSLIEKNNETKNILENATTENIANLIANNKLLTLGNIKASVINNETSTLTNDIAEKTQSTYKDLLTIMQKMTFESTYRLAKLGIDINTQTVTDALNQLNKIEESSYTLALTAENVQASAENISTMKTFFDKLSSLNILNTNFGKLDGEKIIPSISEYSNLFKNNTLAYDVFSTQVSAKWNDKVTDYSSQISDILENLGFEDSKENQEAAEILIRAKVDITENSLLSVKDLNLKLDKIANTLHPKIVANMIKDGINPLNLNIDEIISVIDEYENQFGENLTDKLARNIINLQKDSEVDQETIKAVKAFYQALNTVSKNNKASIARTVNSEHDFTVKNLLDTAKYFDKTKGNRSMVNEAIGDQTIESIIPENSISSTIENALAKSSYEKNLLEKLARNCENDAVINAFENNDIENTLIETLVKQLEDFNKQTANKEISQTDVNALVQKLNLALETSNLSVELLINNDIPPTIKNLSSIKELFESPHKIKEKLNSLLKDEESLQNTFSELTTEDLSSISGVGSVLDVQIGEIENYMPSTDDLLLQKTDILSSFNLMNLFNKNELSPHSQMVVKLPLSDEVTTLNMYVIDSDFETKQTKTIAFNIDTEYLGNISATLKIDGNFADISINGNKNGIDYLQQNQDDIKNIFIENGYKDVMLSFINND